MSADVRRNREDDPRDGSRLEVDDDLACKTCGLTLPWDAVFLYGFDRCPECHLEHERERLLRVFGSTRSLDATIAWSVDDDRGDDQDGGSA